MVEKSKFASIGSIFSSSLSFLGEYQVCHNICLGIVALLAILGVTVVGMPLLFLTKVAIPFWIAAVALLIISLIIYIRKKCLSKNLLILNTGVLVAGVPFQTVSNYLAYFWAAGGTLIVFSVCRFIKDWRK
ncbi:MAG TPA: hypothetical protein VJB94_05460 [Candidatus Nanoarchaeia archaeon]|nr:hypothetical protein [Candidatus Nanoarchaeia archaeon]